VHQFRRKMTSRRGRPIVERAAFSGTELAANFARPRRTKDQGTKSRRRHKCDRRGKNSPKISDATFLMLHEEIGVTVTPAH